MLLQVDIDSTLYNSDKLFHEVAEKEFGINWPEEYYIWFGPEYLDTDLDTLLSIFYRAHSEDYALDQEPYPDAANVLESIVNDFPEVEIAYVSDRDPDHTAVLKEWLAKNGFLHNENAQVQGTKDKRHWMREHRPEVVIDDRVRTILMARYELGSHVIAYEHTHNMNLTGEADKIYVVPNWNDVNLVLRDTIIPDLYENSLTKETEKRYELNE